MVHGLIHGEEPFGGQNDELFDSAAVVFNGLNRESVNVWCAETDSENVHFLCQ